MVQSTATSPRKSPKLKDSLSTNIPEMLAMVTRGGEYDNKFKPGEKQYMYVFAKEDSSEYVHFANEAEQETLSGFQKNDQLQVVREEGIIKNTGKRYTYLNWSPPEGGEAPAASLTSSGQKPLTEPQGKREPMPKQRDRSIVYQSVMKAVAVPLIREGKSAAEVAAAVRFFADDCFRYSSCPE